LSDNWWRDLAWAFSPRKRQEKNIEKNVDQPKVARASLQKIE